MSKQERISPLLSGKPTILREVHRALKGCMLPELKPQADAGLIRSWKRPPFPKMCIRDSCCPFHNDRTPSMKVDSRFYCFGCGASGDVIDFAALLHGLGKREAAVKMCIRDRAMIMSRTPFCCRATIRTTFQCAQIIVVMFMFHPLLRIA